MSSSQNNNELIIIWLDETTKLYDRQKEREIKNFAPRTYSRFEEQSLTCQREIIQWISW